MKIKRIAGTDPRNDHAQIDKELLAAAKPQLGGKTMVVGIRNEAGHIYLTAKSEGLSEFLQVVERLGDFGLVDELEHQSGMWEGCDAIFSSLPTD
jgi:hypothetical protein